MKAGTKSGESLSSKILGFSDSEEGEEIPVKTKGKGSVRTSSGQQPDLSQLFGMTTTKKVASRPASTFTAPAKAPATSEPSLNKEMRSLEQQVATIVKEMMKGQEAMNNRIKSLEQKVESLVQLNETIVTTIGKGSQKISKGVGGLLSIFEAMIEMVPQKNEENVEEYLKVVSGYIEKNFAGTAIKIGEGDEVKNVQNLFELLNIASDEAAQDQEEDDEEEVAEEQHADNNDAEVE
ncbi:MAG: hypothetical protein JWR43_2840 [Phenylobacterium sp.]|jgi:hypothetical protein|nr:hypothetical protein [Phenylobacterium sp.]